ncbi:MAG: hypothetical protein V1792_00380 [Pseudomonadota bacterium]
MHRSGTSLATRLVNLLGVDLGNRVFLQGPDNPKGFWEHEDIKRVHDRLLHSLGGRNSHTVLPLPHQWWLGEGIKPFRDEIVYILKRDFSDSPFWGIKDPRQSRLLPLWKVILSDMNCKPHFLHVIRNPIEVAASLDKRDGFSVYKSILMWFQHVTESEAETRGFPRAFVTFPQVLGDWHSAVCRIASELGIEWPINPDRVRGDVEQFIDGSLRHHSESDDALLVRHDVPRYVADLHLDLVKATQKPGHDVSIVLSRSRAAFEESIRTYFPILGMASDLTWGSPIETRRQIAHKDAVQTDHEKRIAELEAELAAILTSRSWRLTAPLRMVAKRFKGVRKRILVRASEAAT